jgi:hypothetical protein
MKYKITIGSPIKDTIIRNIDGDKIESNSYEYSYEFKKYSKMKKFVKKLLDDPEFVKKLIKKKTKSKIADKGVWYCGLDVYISNNDRMFNLGVFEGYVYCKYDIDFYISNREFGLDMDDKDNINMGSKSEYKAYRKLILKRIKKYNKIAKKKLMETTTSKNVNQNNIQPIRYDIEPKVIKGFCG